MSQAAVNRTAMYTVSHDVLRLLADQRPSVQYFGRVSGAPPPARALRGLRDEGFARLFSGRFGPPAPAVGPRSRTLYLDPLYCLLGDLAAEDVVMVLDLTTVTRPDWHAPHVARAYDAAFDRLSARRPRVIAISRNTADTLYANYGYPPELVSVVPLYVPGHFGDPDAVAPLSSPAPYCLFVGSLEHRKNLVGAIRSFELSGLPEAGYRLLIVGGDGHGAGEIARAAERVPAVRFCGYASNADLRSIYAGASAFVYPSYLEGFGVPLLEALHHGIPSVASSTGACPEVGGDLVRYFDPDDHAAFAHELLRLVALSPEERAAFRVAARRRVADAFSIGRFERALRHALGLAPPTGGDGAAAAGDLPVEVAS